MKLIMSISIITAVVFTIVIFTDGYERSFKTGECFAENGENIMLIETGLKHGVVATNLSEKNNTEKYYVKRTSLISVYDKIDCEAVNFNNIR